MRKAASRAEGRWISGAARVMGAWLVIATVVWTSWILTSPGDTRPRLLLLLAFVVMSAALAPVYGGISYLALKRREHTLSARGALWTSVVLFVLGCGAAAWAYLLLQGVGRGVR